MMKLKEVLNFPMPNGILISPFFPDQLGIILHDPCLVERRKLTIGIRKSTSKLLEYRQAQNGCSRRSGSFFSVVTVCPSYFHPLNRRTTVVHVSVNPHWANSHSVHVSCSHSCFLTTSPFCVVNAIRSHFVPWHFLPAPISPSLCPLNIMSFPSLFYRHSFPKACGSECVGSQSLLPSKHHLTSE